MVSLSELLSLKEKKTLRSLAVLCLFLVALTVASLFFWNFRLNALHRKFVSLSQELEKASAEKDNRKKELELWVNTQKELEELRSSAFYTEKEGPDHFRDDLLQVFKKLGLTVPPINYQYEEVSRQNKQLRKLTASFSLKMNYPAWKKFLYEIETWPRWLIIDQVNFQRIEAATGIMELRLAVSGYIIEGAGKGK
ncbi:MAG: hypothetical protein ACPLRX_02795 [Candidatus Saccharicenans sp.]